MVIICLFAGLAFVGIGLIILTSEFRARQGTHRVAGKVIGFSSGQSGRKGAFHTVAEFVGADYQTWLVESDVSSTAPLNRIGEKVSVSIRQGHPEHVVFQSGFSFLIGVVILGFGLVSLAIFVSYFKLDILNIMIALLVTGLLARKIWSLRRKTPHSQEDWRQMKKQTGKPRLFLLRDIDQIPWVDPIEMANANQNLLKNLRVAMPLCLGLGAVALAASCYLFTETTVFLKTAVSAEAQIVELEQKSSSKSTMYTPIAEFTVPGTGESIRVRHRISSSHPSYRPGDKIRILFNPENPHEARFDSGVWNYFAEGLTGILGLLLTLAGLHNLSKWRDCMIEEQRQAPMPQRNSRGA